MNYNEGGVRGHRVRVTGTGFTQDINDFECKVAGETCEVVSVTDNAAIIEIPAQSVGNTDQGQLPQDVSDT